MAKIETNLQTHLKTRPASDKKNESLKNLEKIKKMVGTVVLYICEPRNVNQALNTYKSQNKDRFVDWCPAMFKVGIA